MFRYAVAALAFALVCPAWAANPVVQADGRICYNAQCQGAYDTPATQCEPAKHSTIPSFKGMEYPQARKALIKGGWTPVQNAEGLGVNEKWAVDAGYYEIESCAGSADVCRFAFVDKRGGKLRVLRHYNKVTAFFPCD